MIQYTDCDLEAIKILDDFLPGKIFDAHMHISPYPFAGADRFGIEDYNRDTLPIFSERYLRCAALLAPVEELKERECQQRAVSFLEEQLDMFADSVGSVIVRPDESYDQISSRVKHPGIRGLKCYHRYAAVQNTYKADVSEYLSGESLAFANDREMPVTLHLVKDRALSDPENMRQVKEIARNFPRVKLILAHCARAFAARTVIESVAELVPYENVFFDFSAICESPAMIAVLGKIGASRCMWGSDYNVSLMLGKAISLGDSFYWINEKDISSFSKSAAVRPRHIIVENLMAMREACTLMGLCAKAVEDVFYNNAVCVFNCERTTKRGVNAGKND